MLNLTINNTPVIFTKPFKGLTPEELAALTQADPKRVVLIDIPPMPGLVQVIHQVREACANTKVILRDHHDVDGNPTMPRDLEIRASADQVRGLLGESATISTRSQNPACSSLIKAGEFQGAGHFLIADNDLDGLTAAMKAAGVTYPGLDEDAAILDGPRVAQTREKGLSALAELLVKGMATLPAYNPTNPAPSEKAKQDLWNSFISATQGDERSRSSLESKVAEYEATVAEAERLATTLQEIHPGVVFVDATQAAKYNLTILGQKMEAVPGCKVTVVKKDNGPIASVHGGIQYSLAVVKSAQAAVNLQTLIPEGHESSPKAGIISNTTFLLHCSEENWNKVVLPALTAI